MSTKFLKVPQVAEALGMTTKAVRQRIVQGQLPDRRWGQRVLIPAHELETFLQSRSSRSATEAAATVEE